MTRVKLLAGGRVTLPKAMRDKKRWPPGTRLIIEETWEGVMLKVDKAPRRPSKRVRR